MLQRHQLPIRLLASRLIPQATSLAWLWRFDCCVVKREYEELTAGAAVWMLEAFGVGEDGGKFRVRTGLRHGIAPRRVAPIRARKKSVEDSNTIKHKQHNKHSNTANTATEQMYVSSTISSPMPLKSVYCRGSENPDRWLPVTRHAASPDRIER
jgi:hypothetical protein